jgi:uncharacterized protein (DUF362 family)
MEKRRVIIRRCETYDVPMIEKIIKEGIEELNEKPHGKILIKPNVVCSTKVVQAAHTHPNVIEAMVNVSREMNPNADVTVGESGGMGIPTRLFFHYAGAGSGAGYTKMAKKARVPLRDFNEERQVRIKLSKAKWHTTMLVAKSLYEANYKIWMPKLKFHNGCKITNAVKLNIGILTHKERMLYHDDRLNEKIVDLLEIGYPNLIVSDAINIGYGQEFAPYNYALGAILIANEPLAVDMVAARILNFEPADVEHLAEARDRGYGTLDFEDIEVSGDVSMDELAEKVRKIDTPYTVRWDVRKVKTPVKFYVGVNPQTGRECSGGCVNALAGSLATSELYWPGLIAGLPRMGLVIGYYKGEVVHPGEKVALIGSCADVEGKLEAGKIIRIKGCPAKGTDQALFLFPKLGIKSAAWTLSSVLPMVYYSMYKGIMQMIKPFRKRIGEPGVPNMQRI